MVRRRVKKRRQTGAGVDDFGFLMEAKPASEWSGSFEFVLVFVLFYISVHGLLLCATDGDG